MQAVATLHIGPNNKFNEKCATHESNHETTAINYFSHFWSNLVRAAHDRALCMAGLKCKCNRSAERDAIFYRFDNELDLRQSEVIYFEGVKHFSRWIWKHHAVKSVVLRVRCTATHLTQFAYLSECTMCANPHSKQQAHETASRTEMVRANEPRAAICVTL